MPTTTIEVINPIPTSTYTWTTPNGNIVGSITDSIVTINAPGTYYVSQQMHTMCPSLAVDSMTILFDPVCTVLDVNITGFNVNSFGKETVFKWQVNINELAESFVIEYSTDNREFKQLAAIDANEKSGLMGYDFHYLLNNNAPLIYYRVKLIGKNKVNKYSNTLLFRTVQVIKNTALIFPNPTKGDVWMSLQSSAKAEVIVSISEITGRLIKTVKIPVVQGINLVSIHIPTEQNAGVYIVKVKTIDGEKTQKLLLKR